MPLPDIIRRARALRPAQQAAYDLDVARKRVRSAEQLVRQKNDALADACSELKEAKAYLRQLEANRR